MLWGVGALRPISSFCWCNKNLFFFFCMTKSKLSQYHSSIMIVPYILEKKTTWNVHEGRGPIGPSGQGAPKFSLRPSTEEGPSWIWVLGQKPDCRSKVRVLNQCQVRWSDIRGILQECSFSTMLCRVRYPKTDALWLWILCTLYSIFHRMDFTFSTQGSFPLSSCPLLCWLSQFALLWDVRNTADNNRGVHHTKRLAQVSWSTGNGHLFPYRNIFGKKI